MRSDFVIGIDEVGRGALAGPVVVAAVGVSKKASLSFCHSREGGNPSSLRNSKSGTLRDSKKLSAKQRAAWFEYFCNDPKISYAVAFVYPRQIEKRNISGAANLAALRAYRKLVRNPRMGSRPPKIFLDGGLFLGSRKLQPAYTKTIVKADEQIPAVAIASIIAKVIRDRAMIRLAKRHPQYGFEIHKGYGTKRHKKALRRYGPSPVHRATFID